MTAPDKKRYLLSFIGTGDYSEVCYRFEGCGAKPTRYVVLALAELLTGDWTSEDEIIVFATREAEKKHWNNVEKQYRSARLKPILTKRIIPSAKNLEEISELFQAIIDLDKESSIILDITHSFRSIPFISTAALSFAAATKSIEVDRILYGAVEILGSRNAIEAMPLEKRIAPVFDLSQYLTIMNWSVAVDRFKQSGDANFLMSLTSEAVTPSLVNTQGKDQNALVTKWVANRLNELSKTLNTCRGLEIENELKLFYKTLEKAESSEILVELKQLLDLIYKDMAVLKGDEVPLLLSSALWCYKHNMIQQAYTFLFESNVSFLLERAGLDCTDVKSRLLAGGALHIAAKGLTKDEWDERCKNNEIEVLKLLEILKDHKNIADCMGRIKAYRNDFNHAGTSTSSIKADDFYRNFEGFFNEIKAFVKHKGKEP